jgi:hypothetical protein
MERKRREAAIIVTEAEETKKIIGKLKAEKDTVEKDIVEKNKELEKIKIFIARLREAQVGSEKDKPVDKDGKKHQISF